MTTLSERLNLSTTKQNVPGYAFKLDRRRDINFYDTLALYCSDNNVDLANISDADFETTADLIKSYARQPEYNEIYLWIDN
jgi:hypothetical protein